MKKEQLKIVNKYLDEKKICSIAKQLPWPYNGMVNDILNAIQSGSNYLAAIGLIAYSEICGRIFFNKGEQFIPADKCLKDLFQSMGNDVVFKWKIPGGKSLTDAVRNGLIHHYFFKAQSCTVAIMPKEKNSNGHKYGFAIVKKTLVMYVASFFRLFCDALYKRHKAGKLPSIPRSFPFGKDHISC